MAERGWRLTRDERDLLRLYEHLADVPDPRLADDLEGFDHPEDRAGKVRLIAIGESEGRLRGVRSQMGLASPFPPVQLTPDGVRHVQEVRAVRDDVARRRPACREALLDWIYRVGDVVDPEGLLSTKPPAEFYGSPFTETEVQNAVRYLV
jgi:hypothetical protein